MTAIDMAWVNQKLNDWAPPPVHPFLFTGQLARASYSNAWQSYNTDAVWNANLSALVSLGVTSIRVDVSYDPWLSQTLDVPMQVRLDVLVAAIKAANVKFILADAAAEYYRPIGHRLTWANFKNTWNSRVSTLAARWHPDSYIVIKEPGWYNGMVINPTQVPADWHDLCVTLCDTVKGVDPNIRTGMAVSFGGAAQPAELAACLPISNLDIIGFDIYASNEYDDVKSWLTTNGDAGKQVWTPECWTTPFSPFDPTRAELDRKWVRAHYDWTQTQQPSCVEMSPFFSDCFFMYDQPTVEATLLSRYSQRTPAGLAYAGIIDP